MPAVLHAGQQASFPGTRNGSWYGFVTMPEYWSLLRQAFRWGRNCRPIENWKFLRFVRTGSRYGDQRRNMIRVWLLQPVDRVMYLYPEAGNGAPDADAALERSATMYSHNSAAKRSEGHVTGAVLNITCINLCSADHPHSFHFSIT